VEVCVDASVALVPGERSLDRQLNLPTVLRAAIPRMQPTGRMSARRRAGRRPPVAPLKEEPACFTPKEHRIERTRRSRRGRCRCRKALAGES
jgi:hypothetical protein